MTATDRPLEPVVLETPRYRIEGEVMLPPTGYRSRLSDFLNDQEREFLIVLHAKLTPLDGAGTASEAGVVMLHRSRIDLIIPLTSAGAR